MCRELCQASYSGRRVACSTTAHEQAEPLLLLDTGRCLEAVRWAPGDSYVVLAAASDDAVVQLYDLQNTAVIHFGRPDRLHPGARAPLHVARV